MLIASERTMFRNRVEKPTNYVTGGVITLVLEQRLKCLRRHNLTIFIPLFFCIVLRAAHWRFCT